MTLSKTIEYALRTLAFMARSPRDTFSCSSLHRSLRISEKYLQRILTDLTRNGIIVSGRGRNGGYRLGRSSDEISLADVIAATEGLESRSRCFFGFESCPVDNPCAMHEFWSKNQADVPQTLRRTRLSDLVPGRPGG
jgi:Rrf2 family protein